LNYRDCNWVAETVEQSDLHLTNAELPNNISSSAPFFCSVLFEPSHTLVQKNNNKLEENVAQAAFNASVNSTRRKKLVPLKAIYRLFCFTL